MQQESKNSLLVLGIAISLTSLWVTWLNYDQVPIRSPFAEVQQSLMGNSEPVTYTAQINGFQGKLLYVPIWAAVLLGTSAHTIQLMAATKFFFIPTAIKWSTAVAGVFFPVFAIVSPLFYTGITPNFGPYVALLGAAISLTTLCIADSGDDNTA